MASAPSNLESEVNPIEIYLTLKMTNHWGTLKNPKFCPGASIKSQGHGERLRRPPQLIK